MKKQFLIDTPPPTISSTSLHIGHIFSYTQGNIIANYQRYIGNELIYPNCFDCNGIPTAKLARKKGIVDPNDIITFAEKIAIEYSKIFNSANINFEPHSYHTYDKMSIELAYKAFDILLQKGFLYKAETEFLYCEKTKCSISQSELTEDGRYERSGEFPIIKKGIGYFIDIKNHIPKIKERIEQIEWKPEKYKKRILDWLDNIQWDWSISRERHFGIPIPNEENMTFDTWFISSLSPILAYSSYTKNNSLECPIFDIRFQSHDIIRTWALYTIIMSEFLNNQIPWKTLLITGHAIDKNGDKYSKSKGNAVLPQHLINQYGANGMTYWACSNKIGTDTQIDELTMKNGWRLMNKFNNAKKF